MVKQITSIDKLEKILNRAIECAIKNLTITVRDKLKEFIDRSYYQKYSPKIYDRTRQFASSAAYKMLNQNSSIVYVNTANMSYEDATGKYVAELANFGVHGNWSIQRPGRYWDEFEEWLNNNFDDLVKTELRKQGLDIQ